MLVVARRAHDAVQQLVEAVARGDGALGHEAGDQARQARVVVAAQPRPQPARVALRVRAHEEVPERRVAGRAREPQQRQRVAARAAQRRGQHAEERRLVARVGQRREPREEVADLAAAPPAAAAARERREAEVLQGALDRRQRTQGAGEDDDLARPALPGVDERADALGDEARLGRERGPVGVEARPRAAVRSGAAAGGVVVPFAAPSQAVASVTSSSTRPAGSGGSSRPATSGT